MVRLPSRSGGETASLRVKSAQRKREQGKTSSDVGSTARKAAKEEPLCPEELQKEKNHNKPKIREMNNGETANIHMGKQVGKKGTEEMRVGEVQNADMVRGRCHTAILAFTTSLKKQLLVDMLVCSYAGMKRLAS